MTDESKPKTQTDPADHDPEDTGGAYTAKSPRPASTEDKSWPPKGMETKER